MQLVIAKEVLLIHRSHYKLRIVNFTVAIGVHLGKHIIDLLVRQSLSEKFCITVFNFIFGELAITVHVHGSENFIDISFLLLGQKLGSDKGIGGLLEFGSSIEVLQVFQRAHGYISAQVGFL